MSEFARPSVQNYNYYNNPVEEMEPDTDKTIGLVDRFRQGARKARRKLAAGALAASLGLPMIAACGDSDPVAAKPQANSATETTKAGTETPAPAASEQIATLREDLEKSILKEVDVLRSTSVDPYGKEEEDVLLEINGKMNDLANAGVTPEIFAIRNKLRNLPNLTTEEQNSLLDMGIIEFGTEVSKKITEELTEDGGFFKDVDEGTRLALQAIRANRITCGLVGEMNGNPYTAKFIPVAQSQASSYNYKDQGWVRFENSSTTQACTNDDGKNYEDQAPNPPYRNTFHFIYRQVNKKGKQSYNGHALRLTTAELMQIEPFVPMNPIK